MSRSSLALALVLGVLACRSAPLAGEAPSGLAGQAPARAWAQPVERPGLPNLHRVGDNLWRGAQPTEVGFRELELLGVRTVLSLRGFHDDDLPPGSALGYESIPVNSWHPEDDEVVRFLRVVSDPARQPVFVHCQHGSDRTGMMCAIYRIACEGWSREEALAEMTGGGFGFHPVLGNLVGYVRRADLERLAAAAGLPRPVERR